MGGQTDKREKHETLFYLISYMTLCSLAEISTDQVSNAPWFGKFLQKISLLFKIEAFFNVSDDVKTDKNKRK